MFNFLMSKQSCKLLQLLLQYKAMGKKVKRKV